MRLLSQHDVRELLAMHDCIEVMADALAALARGEAMMPLRTVVRLPQPPNVFAMMPAHRTDPAAIGVKVITVFPGNHGTALDSHQGAILLFDARDGHLEAILDATSVTAIRTAAVSAVATRLLARQDASVVAILGAGVQGRMHVEALSQVRDLAAVRIWSRDPQRATRLSEHTREKLGVESTIFATAEEAVRDADIVCTTTSAREPVLRGAWLREGTHVNAIGACTPDARELDTEAVRRAALFVDRRESALREPGDLLVPLHEGAITSDHVRAELGELLTGAHPGRSDDREITLFKSLGLAVEDLAAAQFVAARARERGVGLEVDLGGGRE